MEISNPLHNHSLPFQLWYYSFLPKQMNEAECNASIKKIVKKDGLHKVEISSPYYNDIHLEFHKVEFEINETDF